MSRVATAESPALQVNPMELEPFWNLTISASSLTGQLAALQVMAQLPVQALANVNKVLGGVWDIGNENSYTLLGGRTAAVEKEGQPQQTVSFDIVYKGEFYTFSGGVLSYDPLSDQWS